MTNSTIYAVRQKRTGENNSLNLTPSLKRIETYTDGPIHSFTLTFNDAGGVSRPNQVQHGDYIETIRINNKEILRGYVDNIDMNNEPADAYFEGSPNSKSCNRKATITGRCVARELVHKFLTYKWTKTPSTHIISQALKLMENTQLTPNHTPLPSIEVNPSDWYYINRPGINTDYDARDTYLIELCNELTQKAEMGYGVNFTLNSRGKHDLTVWKLSEAPEIKDDNGLRLLLRTPTMWTTPQRSTGNILSVDSLCTSVDSLSNVVKIKGGNIDDFFTENSSKYWYIVKIPGHESDVSVHDDSQVKYVGDYSIRVDMPFKPAWHNQAVDRQEFEVHVKIPPSYGYLDCSQLKISEASVNFIHNFFDITDSTGSSEPKRIDIHLKDTAGNIIRWGWQEGIRVGGAGQSTIAKWFKKTFQIGNDVDYVTDYPGVNHNKDSIGWIYDKTSTAKFNWKIVDIWFTILITSYRGSPGIGLYNTVSLWIDGLFFKDLEAYAVAYNIPSMIQDGTRMIPISKPDVPKSFEALQEIADNELLMRFHSLEHIKVRTTIQPNILYTGLILDVLAPQYHIFKGNYNNPQPLTYRIETIRHVVEPGTPLFRGHDAYTELTLILHLDPATNNVIPIGVTRSSQISNPQQSTNVSYDNRLRRLEDYPNNPAGTGSNSSNSSGSGGLSNWNGGFISGDNITFLSGAWPHLNEAKHEVEHWLWQKYATWHDMTPILKFYEDGSKGTWWNAFFYPLLVNNSDDFTSDFVGPSLGTSFNFVTRGDNLCKGMYKSYEGCLNLHNSLNETGRARALNILTQNSPLIKGDHARCGWGPGFNPFIWLSDGGTNKPKKYNGQPVDVDVDTLEIRVSGNYPEWGWGNLACGNLTVHGSMSALALIQAGDGTCGLNGTCTVWFDHKYTEAPIVTVSLKPGDADTGYDIRIMQITYEHFTVYIGTHRHKIGAIGTSRNMIAYGTVNSLPNPGTNVFSTQTPLTVVPLKLNHSNTTSATTDGWMMTNETVNSDRNIWSTQAEEFAQPMTFTWIATPRTQKHTQG